MQRLSKVLAKAGVASRRKCEELIFEGQVKVDGSVVKIPQTMVDLAQNKIEVNGEPIQGEEKKVYYLLNKPKGYLCSNKRHRGDRLVIDLFNADERLFTVGRLDKDTTGLLLVTNDGAFANQVMHPSSNISKEYLVKVDRPVSDQDLRTIAQGCVVEGTFVKPKRVRKMRRGTVLVTVMEGRKREVRHLVMRAGMKIRQLTRIRIGGLSLGKLPIGSARVLSARERDSLLEG